MADAATILQNDAWKAFWAPQAVYSAVSRELTKIFGKDAEGMSEVVASDMAAAMHERFAPVPLPSEDPIVCGRVTIPRSIQSENIQAIVIASVGVCKVPREGADIAFKRAGSPSPRAETDANYGLVPESPIEVRVGRPRQQPAI